VRTLLLNAGIAHYEFVGVHPFIDGNGRTARVIAAVVLYVRGFDTCRFACRFAPTPCFIDSYIVSNSISIRVRFAPSPTGYLHVGGLRTALYNYLFARRNAGACILRIEDTDRTRHVEGAVENMIETLKWSGVKFDEGPGIDGKYGPYVQSQRLGIYSKHVDMLLEKRKAYRCFCASERLEKMRKKQEKMKVSPKYDRHCLTLTEKEIQHNLSQKIPFVVRMKIPDNTTVVVEDAIRGKVEFGSDILDDQILLKSDGYPTYHLANVVDDHLMEISHVIRGEEWLSSTPKHVLLYQYFEWRLPMFAHLPLILNPDKSKLSKRQGDVAVEDYRAKGYLKEAIVNFIAFLGWNPGNEREMFTLEELEKEFSLDRVGKAGAVFNIEKLNWLNGQYLRMKPAHEIVAMLKEYLAASKRFNGQHFDDKYLSKVIEVMRERATFVKDFVEKCPYLYEPPKEYDATVIKKRWKPESSNHLHKLAGEFSILSNPRKEDYEAALHRAALSLKVHHGDLIHPLRLAVSGMGVGPGLYDILFILGKDEVIRRITKARETIKPH
jgi:glutamyl-tRNA synthetase